MDNRIGIGIIGCGRWGQNLIRAFNGLLDARVVIYSNKSNKGRLEELKTIFPLIKSTQNITDVMENPDVDAVVVSTPDATHFDIAKRALKAGKHLFVEKPIALSFDQAKELVASAKSQNKILMAGHIMQYHPAIQWIKERLATGQANPISILSSRIDFGIAAADANLLWSSVIHDVSMIQYLLGSEPKELCVAGSSFNAQKLNDILYINMVFPLNVVGHIHAGFAGPYRERRLILHTTEEIIVFDGVSGHLDLFSRKVSRPGNGYGIREYEKQFGGAKRVELPDLREPLAVECQHFLDCINTNTTPISGGENVLAVMRTITRLDKALKSTGVS